MINNQIQVILSNTPPSKSTESNQNQDYQHGLLLLLDIPSESLTHITSYLDPPSLLALARVNKLLYQHVKDDNTWRRAFLWQFLGIGPESDLQNTRSVMLRRSERYWRNEFIVRCSLRRRWQRSRNATISHIPLHSSISCMHLMPSHSLLTSSLQYGIVARSLPLTGKILRGYLDASGTGSGLGIGNPNAEFTPNVSACALASDGGTAKILWGYRNGEVAVMTGNKVMDAGGRAAAKLVRCKVDEEHEGPVLDAAWDGPMVVTGGADGRVKIWDVKKVRCVWASESKAGTLVPDPCVKIASALGKGFVAGGMKSGEVVIWVEFDLESLVGNPSDPVIKEIRLSSLVVTRPDTESPSSSHEITALYVDPAASSPTLLVTYDDHPHFYRHRVDVNTNSVEHTTFGDKSFGPISSLQSYLSNQVGESSFVITGDHLGCVNIYDWALPSAPIRAFEAHQDGSSVTALAWNGVTLITGSARGMVHVWDALTFEHLRSFTSPVSRDRGGRAGTEDKPVSQILVGPEKELLLVSVADRVMAWRAGPVPKNEKARGGVRGRNGKGAGTPGKRKREKSGAAKYIQKLEMHQTVVESRNLLEQESEHVQRAYGREREQRARLEMLGLDEVEAVEYVLMLSRDEAMERAGPNLGPGVGALVEEGVFEGDFDDIPNPMAPNNSNANTSPSDVSPLSSPPSSSSSSSPSSRRSSVSVHQRGRHIPRTSPSLLNHKIQVSPRLRAEPNEAGFGSGSALRGDISSSAVRIPDPPIPADPSHFPPISTSTSPGNVGNMTATASRGAVNGSPRSVGTGWVCRPLSEPGKSTSAWSTPALKSVAPVPGSSVRRPNAWAGRINNGAEGSRSPGPALGKGYLPGNGKVRDNRRGEEMDDDLKLAIELSLADARSPG